MNTAKKDECSYVSVVFYFSELIYLFICLFIFLVVYLFVTRVDNVICLHAMF